MGLEDRVEAKVKELLSELTEKLERAVDFDKHADSVLVAMARSRHSYLWLLGIWFFGVVCGNALQGFLS